MKFSVDSPHQNLSSKCHLDPYRSTIPLIDMNIKANLLIFFSKSAHRTKIGIDKIEPHGIYRLYLKVFSMVNSHGNVRKEILVLEYDTCATQNCICNELTPVAKNAL
jgi:hypothetical protein